MLDVFRTLVRHLRISIEDHTPSVEASHNSVFQVYIYIVVEVEEEDIRHVVEVEEGEGMILGIRLLIDVHVECRM